MPFPTVILPGYLASASAYADLVAAMNAAGIPTVVVPLKQRDWWPTLGGRSMVPILRRLHATVEQLRAERGSEQVNLVGHSAGGWIARIYLGEQPYTVHGDVTAAEGTWAAHPHVATLVTLGTPHTSQERWTKRNLDFVQTHYPGAFYPDVRYVCVAGRAVYGQRWRSWFAYNSYQLTCGQGACWGDGITPVAAAHLPGATNLVFEDVYHSPSSPGLWYGSASVRPRWLPYLQTPAPVSDNS